RRAARERGRRQHEPEEHGGEVEYETLHREESGSGPRKQASAGEKRWKGGLTESVPHAHRMRGRAQGTLKSAVATLPSCASVSKISSNRSPPRRASTSSATSAGRCSTSARRSPCARGCAATSSKAATRGRRSGSSPSGSPTSR